MASRESAQERIHHEQIMRRKVEQETLRQEEIATHKAEEEEKRRIAEKLAQFEQMQQQILELQQKAGLVAAAEAQVNSLLQSGLVKIAEDGNVEPVSGFDEQQHILTLRA